MDHQPDSMAEQRKNLRAAKLAERDALSAAQREEKSKIIRDRLFDIEEVAQAKNIMIYVNFRSEVETIPLFEMLSEKQMQVTVPLTIKETHRLIAYHITDPQKELRPGYYGIPEPDASRLSPADPAGIDVVLVPGSVFDPHGGRLGYGGGFYDRFLADDAPQALRIALAFQAQVVDRVPVLDHDEKMHYLLTEKQLIQIKG